MAIIPFEDHSPKIGRTAFVAPDAWVIGKVEVGDDVSIFFGAVLRGDIQRITVGSGTNIQEHALLHTSHDLPDCVVGSNVTVGHRAIVHGCTIEDECIVGMGSTVLDGAVVGAGSIVGAQALVPMNAKIPPRSLVVGVPAKVVRTLTEAEVESIRLSAKHYIETGRKFGAYFAAKR